MAKRTEAQITAEETYRKKTDNKILNRRNYKSKALNFIKKLATYDELQELENLIKERKRSLKKYG